MDTNASNAQQTLLLQMVTNNVLLPQPVPDSTNILEMPVTAMLVELANKDGAQPLTEDHA
jgi:hypothetical protein